LPPGNVEQFLLQKNKKIADLLQMGIMGCRCSIGVSIGDEGRPPDFGKGDAHTNVPRFGQNNALICNNRFSLASHYSSTVGVEMAIAAAARGRRPQPQIKVHSNF